MNPAVDDYIDRSDQWPAEMRAVRSVLLDCDLTEQIKWRKPCYIHDGKNVAILQEMKDFLALMFFNGALIDDPDGVLESQGPNSRAARRIRFTSVEDVERLSDAIRSCVSSAVEADAEGRTLAPAPKLALADELSSRLAADSDLRAAFEALTPGRQREYNLHISGAKKKATRESRVDRCVPKILAGKGFRDR